MNEHAGPACALSGLIVGIFAVLLHEKNPPPPAPRPTSRDAAITSPADGKPPKSEAPPAIRPAPRPPTVAAEPARSPQVSQARPVVAAEAAPPMIEVMARGPARPSIAEAAPALAGPMVRSDAGSPRPSFAIVGPGETLADVAARVYGSREEAEALWKANRDQVERVDSAVPSGTLLRAP